MSDTQVKEPFFTGYLKIATQEVCSARWSCGRPGEHFRCGFCGYKFVVGDKYRLVYTNDLEGAGGNPIVCEKCDNTNLVLRFQWRTKHATWREITNSPEWWWFTRGDGR